MQKRQFTFNSHVIELFCREPPEAQAGKTLTWQIGDHVLGSRSAADEGDARSGGNASIAAAPAAAPAAAAGSDVPAAAPVQPASREPDPDLIGLDVWPACLALCRYLAAHPLLVAGQQVLELGAGMGMVGLLCAKLGAAHVLLTDYEPQVLSHLDENIALNSLQQRCASQRLDWREPGSSLRPGQQSAWRVVVAADVLYASAVVQPFIETLQMVLHTNGVALLGHQVRRAVVLDPATRLPRLEEHDEPLQAFQSRCQQAGLCVRVLSSRPTCSNVDVDPMVLLAVAWAGSGASGSGGVEGSHLEVLAGLPADDTS